MSNDKPVYILGRWRDLDSLRECTRVAERLRADRAEKELATLKEKL